MPNEKIFAFSVFCDILLSLIHIYFEVPEGCYLMLGDNRNYSADARYWPDPYVPEKKILAKVLFRYYPRIGKIK